jgi:hypothetical protein
LKVASSLAAAAETAATKEALKPLTKTALSTSGKLIQGAFAGLNIGLAIYDIVTLVKAWNTDHPAITAIDSASETLCKLEVQVLPTPM